MSYWLSAFDVDRDEAMVLEIEITREQFEALMGESIDNYRGGEIPLSLYFSVGEESP